jgi:hypothetical protein
MTDPIIHFYITTNSSTDHIIQRFHRNQLSNKNTYGHGNRNMKPRSGVNMSGENSVLNIKLIGQLGRID